MFAGCCNLDQIKYIREDGTIDQSRLKSALKAAQEPELGEDRDVCTCPCHQDGRDCFC